MLMKDIDEGQYAWLGLIAYVIAYDVVALLKDKRTLSGTFYSATTNKIGRVLLAALWGYLTAHLFRLLPKRYDLFRKFL
jgi:hypothetical protein